MTSGDIFHSLCLMLMTISLWNLKMAHLMMKVHASHKGECFSQSPLNVDNQFLEPEIIIHKKYSIACCITSFGGTLQSCCSHMTALESEPCGPLESEPCGPLESGPCGPLESEAHGPLEIGPRGPLKSGPHVDHLKVDHVDHSKVDHVDHSEVDHDLLAKQQPHSSRRRTRAMFSKHFLRCGCTAVGSLVCDRISSSSSSDRK